MEKKVEKKCETCERLREYVKLRDISIQKLNNRLQIIKAQADVNFT